MASSTSKRPRAVSSEKADYRFEIDAFTPQTIPMVRLAEYMREIAGVLGETDAVHFKGLEEGSTVLVSTVEREAIPKVSARAAAVRRGDAPRDALRAYRKINQMLRSDNAVGVLKDQRAGNIVIRFPGREEVEETFPCVRQHGSVDGTVVRVGGVDQTVHVTLQSDDQQVVSGCYTNRMVGKELGQRLFEPVRLFGRGRWCRDGEGQWSLLEFKIESFEPLSDMTLSTALSELRTIETDWDDQSFDELSLIRHGPPEEINNGGH